MSKMVTAFDVDLAKVVEENIAEYHKQMNAVDYPRFGSIMESSSRTNKYIDETKLLGSLAKEDGDKDQIAAGHGSLVAFVSCHQSNHL